MFGFRRVARACPSSGLPDPPKAKAKKLASPATSAAAPWTPARRSRGTPRGGAAERGRSSRPSACGRRWCSASPTWSPWTSPPTRSSRRGRPRPWSTPSARCPTSPRAATPCTSTSARSPRTGSPLCAPRPRPAGHGCSTPWPPPLPCNGWRCAPDGVVGRTCMLICCTCKFPMVRVLIVTRHSLPAPPIFDSLSAPLHSCILIPLDMIWIWVSLVSRKRNADSVPVLIGFV